MKSEDKNTLSMSKKFVTLSYKRVNMSGHPTYKNWLLIKTYELQMTQAREYTLNVITNNRKSEVGCHVECQKMSKKKGVDLWPVLFILFFV